MKARIQTEGAGWVPTVLLDDVAKSANNAYGADAFTRTSGGREGLLEAEVDPIALQRVLESAERGLLDKADEQNKLWVQNIFLEKECVYSFIPQVQAKTPPPLIPIAPDQAAALATSIDLLILTVTEAERQALYETMTSLLAAC